MPVIRASLHLPGITQDFVAIDFLVDTGATESYLHPQDAKVRVGIDPSMLAEPQRWPDRQVTNGIGGTVICYVRPAIFLFHHDDGQEQQITHEISIVPPTPANSVLPSILGMDVLSHFILSMDYVGLRLVLE